MQSLRKKYRRPGEPLDVRRICAGCYELTAGPYSGTDIIYEIDDHTEGWYLTYPGRLVADDVYGTKRAAVAAANYHYFNILEGV